MGLGARIGLSCWLCMSEAALVLTLGVRRLGVRPRGDGRAHVGGKELSEEERAGEEVTDDRLEVL